MKPTDALPCDDTQLPAWEMLSVLKDDAVKWADAFQQHAVKLGYSEMDSGWLIGWFANAIEGSADHRNRRAPGERDKALERENEDLKEMMRGVATQLSKAAGPRP